MTQPVPTPVPTPPPGDPAPPAPTTPPTPAPARPADPPDDKPLGPAGEKAFREEREARKELEKKLAALAPLQKLAEAIGGGGQQPPGGKTEVELLNERFAELERVAGDERAARWRIEVATAKGLSAEQAPWLTGTTREEFEASADKLLAAFPAGPRTPVPDPSQGARLGATGVDIAAQVAAAVKAGDWRKAAALEKTKLAELKR